MAAEPNPTALNALRIGGSASAGYPLFGAFASPYYTYTVVPPTLALAGLGALQAPVTGAAFTLTSTGAVTIGGISYIDLGVARQITASGTDGGVQSVSMTIRGLEEMVLLDGTLSAGKAMTQTINGPTGTAAVAATTKTFRYVRDVTVAASTSGSVSIGYNDTLGFPYKVPYVGAVQINYDGTVITSSAGFTAPVTTSPATAFTGDVRGTYALQSAANGIKRFVATIWQIDPNTTTAIYGVPQA